MVTLVWKEKISAISITDICMRSLYFGCRHSSRIMIQDFVIAEKRRKSFALEMRIFWRKFLGILLESEKM